MSTGVASPPTLFLTDADVRQSFDWAAGATALKAAYAGDVSDEMFPPRSMARGNGLWLRTLSGVTSGNGVVGAKLIMASLSSSTASYLISLFNPQSGALDALLDGASVTGFRTAVTTALAADALTPAGAVTVAVIGSGFEAKTHLQALAAVRAISAAYVFSPNPDSRAKFIFDLSHLEIDIKSAESAQCAVASASLVLCAARSRDESPTIRGAWLRPGMTVLSIGSTLPEQRELDPDAIARADMIVCDMVDEVAHDTGDMIAAKAAGVDFDARLLPLSAVISGRHPGRTSGEQIWLYKSVGAAIQDLVIAAVCVKRARELGLGTELPVSITPVYKGKQGRLANIKPQ